MSNERFTDELLSAIIDGEADTELVASVSNSPEASARLEHMRQAVQLVAEAPAEATPQRRSASIAAAMAAASPAPEVTSLAAARHDRDVAEKKKRSLSGGWVVAVAAAVAFLIAIPIAIGFGAGDAVTDTAADTVDSASLEVPNAAGDAADDTADAVEETVDGDEEEAMEEEAMEDDAMEEEAMEDATVETEAANEPPATTAATTIARAQRFFELLNGESLTSGNSADVLNDLIAIGTIEPLYSADDLLFAEVVAADCLQADAVSNSPTPYGLAELTPFGGEDRLILVEFADDGTSRLLDAEDCAVLR